MSLKDDIRDTKYRAKQWLSDHKGDIIYGCYIAACIGAVALPVISKARKNHMDIKRDRMVYDPSLGFWWETKRTLTNNQKLAIEQRHKMGEPYGQILRDMHLLKK